MSFFAGIERLVMEEETIEHRTQLEFGAGAEREERDVILIDSDSEDDGSNRDVLGGDRDVGSGSGNNNDDDIRIYRETSRQVDYQDGVETGAEYIDLEREPAVDWPDRSNRPGITVYNEGGDTQGAESEGDSRDDGLMILQERMSAPAIRLSVPGREFVEIRATPYDRPVRRSFEMQEHDRQLRQPGRRRLRRAALRASRLRNQLHDDDGDDFHPASTQRIPARLVRRRRLELARPQQAVYSSGDPILAELQTRVDSFPPDIRSAFNHAQTINEFRSILQSVDPLTWQECNSELEQLYNAYRSRLSIVAADQARNISTNSARRINDTYRFDDRLRPLGFHIGVGGGMGESLTRYLLEHDPHTNGGYGLMAYPGGFFDEMDEEARTQSIVNAIQEREERERDIRVKNYVEKSKPQEEMFIERCKTLPEGYSASFDTKIQNRMDVSEDGKERTITVDDELPEEWEEVAVCCLCGVELGVGIPDDFEGMTKEDRSVSFEVLTAKYESFCPYQSLARPTKIDRDLSKKTFVASCGHTYCGRCVVRIHNARSRCSSRESRKKWAELKGSSHPDNYGPKTCPATDCKQPIRSARSKMREAFL